MIIKYRRRPMPILIEIVPN